VLRIVNGGTGATIRSVGDLEIAPVGTGQPLLVDLDGDGRTEIVYLHYSRSKLIALNHDGSRRWTRPLSAVHAPGAEIGTYFDPDKKARLLIVGKEVIAESKKSPVVIGSLPSASGGVTSFVYPADPQNPSALFLFDSTGVHDLRTGARKIAYPQTSLVAVAELSASDRGFEIVGTGGGRLWIMNALSGRMVLERDLQVYNPLLCPAGSIGGGVPTVGDFDGDPSTVEIAMATGKYLTIFSATGELIAQKETQDCSSLATGISSFDFNGDGKQEIVYGDEEYLRIYEIRDGRLEEVWKTVNPSGTLYEYPVIVDVDGNGGSDIVVASNNYPVAGFYRDESKSADRAKALLVTGVRAFESADRQAWMPTPSAWPQFSYNPVMEVLADSRGNVITALLEGFLGKTFRQNAALTATRLGCRE
ncbi:MAG TPA: VCBS repeat-containing protein, partial [Pseudobdellovibrionaceae bacterium]|nr:VCBS repeat-containing protein [Pseudobdellovibrionaceae bacterium]